MEYLRNEGALLTLEHCTAASNIAAGTPVALASNTSVIYTLGHDPAGLSCTALLGYHFIGVLDEAISANASPVTVWTEGVFKFQTSSACESGDFKPGNPVFADSGIVVNVGTGLTSDAAIGTLLNRPAECSGSATIFVKINPARFRWTTWCGPTDIDSAQGKPTATQATPFGWPKLTGHA